MKGSVTAIEASSGGLIRVLPDPTGVFGFHQRFGLVSAEAAAERLRCRRRQGLPASGRWLFRFCLEISASGATELVCLEGCEAEPSGDGGWWLRTAVGAFRVGAGASLDETRLGAPARAEGRPWEGLAAIALALVALALLPRGQSPTASPPEPNSEPPVSLTVTRHHPRTVAIPAASVPGPERAVHLAARRATTTRPGGAAASENLGFLKLLGKKDLRQALGGAPTEIREATAGAGAGGKGGSGGELLAGLGAGLKRATVGNTGVSGLGGAGHLGQGGGRGGAGDSLFGSGGEGNALRGLGNGRALAKAALSDDIVLEGGLDAAVIQATIAKYLSQVRACYERGLEANPSLVGQVTMRFEVGPSGSLNYARVGQSSLPDPKVADCISRRMMGWIFPKPLGGVNVKVSYPFLLRPVNS